MELIVMELIVCITNEYGSHHLQRPLWDGMWEKGKPGYGFPNLTPGKTYEASPIKWNNNIGEFDNYRLIDDSNVNNTYPKSIFITLNEFREDKLNQILK